MDLVYSKKFFNDFYEENGGGNYLDRERWLPFFKEVARNIVENFEPKTVLDAGCACGYLVECLRDLGVEAYGFDISSYSIENVREDIKQYCFVHSILEPIPAEYPQKYDIVVTIEVLEHLFSEQGEKAIQNLCQYSDVVVFSSTPDDIEDRTHVNVRPLEYWARIFAQNNFSRQLVYQPDYISPWAAVFTRFDECRDVIFNYELNMRIDNMQKEMLVDVDKCDIDLQLYYDEGTGFSEKNSLIVRHSVVTGQDNIIHIDLEKKVNNLRIDSICKAGTVYIKNVSIINKDNELMEVDLSLLTSNANRVIENKIYQFNVDDANIMCANIDEEIKGLIINIGFVYYNSKLNSIVDVVIDIEEDNIQKLTNSINEQKNVLEDQINIITKKEEIICKLEDELEDSKSNCRKLEEEKNGFEQEKNRLEEERISFKQEKSKLEEEKNRLEEESNRLVEENKVLIQEKNDIEEEKKKEKEEKIKAIEENYRNSESNSKLTAEIHDLRERIEEIKKQLYRVELEKVNVEKEYQTVINAFFWKITKPLRKLCDIIKKLERIKCFYLLAKTIRSIKSYGLKETYHKIKDYSRKNESIQEKLFIDSIDEENRKRQSEYEFNKKYKFSVVIPLYNTPIDFLQDMIDSLMRQTYSEWEVCVADGSDDDHAYVKKYIKELMRKDNRIKYTKLKRNGGIAENTIGAFKMATGDYIVLMDHDDILTEDALFELNLCANENADVDFIYSDKGIFDDKTKNILAYHYLPDYSPEFLRACNYASHLNAFSKYIIDKVGFIRTGYDGSQDYDFELRVAEQARNMQHIDKVLYYCRACEGSVALNPENKMYAYEAGRKAIEEHINRIGYPGKVEFLPNTFSYRIHYDILENDEVCIIIPNKDHVQDLKRCVSSILQKTDYRNYRILIVENNSENEETFNYYNEIVKDDKVGVIKYQDKGFNYSKINNYAVSQCNSRYVLFLNNDTEVINSNWLTEMLMFAQRKDVGAVGAKLYYEDGTYQHIGLFIGLGNHIATHYAHRKSGNETGYMHRVSMPQNYNAVTAACLLVEREKFEQVNGFDEVNFKVGLNDVDLCLKLRECGLLNVVTPYAELYHYESLSRGSDEDGENQVRFTKEQEAFRTKWKKYFDCSDSYYNINLKI